MKYDFTTVPNRLPMSSGKWLGMKKANPDVPDGIVPFSTADMDLMLAPQIAEGLQEYIGSTITGYTRPWSGYLESVVTWMQARHNWSIQKDWIVTTPGIVPALYDAVNAYTKPGEGVIIFTPVYFPFYSAITENGRKIVESALIHSDDTYSIDFEDFAQKAADPQNTMIIFCSPHNPIGRVWSRDELERIGKICLENGIIIVCDEIHNDLIMPGHTHTVLASLSDELSNITLTCTAASKTFNLAGLQTANLISANPEIRAKISKAMGSHGIHGGNMMGYRATEIAYTRCADWLEECIALIYDNYCYIQDYCQKHIPEIRVSPMEGTYLAWLDLGAFGLDDKTLLNDLAQKAFLFPSAGEQFGTAGRGCIRLTLACPKSVIADAMSRLDKWAASTRK